MIKDENVSTTEKIYIIIKMRWSKKENGKI